MMDALFAHGLDINESAVRQSLLSSAVYQDDFELAKIMLISDGHAAIYQEPVNPEIVWHIRNTTPEIRRLFFDNIHRFAPTLPERMRDLRDQESMALSYAEEFDVFGELLGKLTHATPVQRFLVACQREGGIQEVEKHDGVLDLSTPISRSRVLNREVPVTTLTLGIEALRRAITFEIPANVEILLERGVESADEIRAGVHHWWPESDADKFYEIQRLLSRRSPRVVLVQWSNPAQVIWTSDQAVILKSDEVKWAEPIERSRDECLPLPDSSDDGY